MRTALVTGANRGIGLAIARGLAARGDVRVLAAARHSDDAQRTAQQIGHDAVGVALALDDPQQVFERAQQIADAHGPVDILVNNAGVLIEGDALSIEVETLTQSLQVNAVAAFALIRALAPTMRERSWGRIVNLSSGWGSFGEGLSGPAAYSISKAALNAVTMSAARALGSKVKVNAACPGWVRTAMGGEAASRSPEEGADTPIWLATLPDNGPTGGFFRNRRPIGW